MELECYEEAIVQLLMGASSFHLFEITVCVMFFFYVSQLMILQWPKR